MPHVGTVSLSVYFVQSGPPVVKTKVQCYEIIVLLISIHYQSATAALPPCSMYPTAARHHNKRLLRMHHELWLCPLRLSMPRPEVCARSAPVCEPIRHNLLPVILHSKSVFDMVQNSMLQNCRHFLACVTAALVLFYCFKPEQEPGLPEWTPVVINWKSRVSAARRLW